MRVALPLLLLACDGADRTSVDLCETRAEPVSHYPSGPYGAGVGDTFADFELEDCDGQTVAFRDILARSDLVHFNVGAGWCAPCVEETRTLEADFRAWCGQRVSVVQVLFEDANARPATGFFCREWRKTHGLTFPVLRDPLFTTERLFQDAQTQTPLNLLIDPSGVIVYREVGTAGEGVNAAIESYLEAR